MSSVAGNAAIWWSSLLVARGPNGFLEMGAFQAAYVLRNLVLFLPSQINRVSTPLLTNLWSRGSTAGYAGLLRVNLGLNLLISAVSAVGLIALGEPALRLFGSQFGGKVEVVVILGAAAVAEAVAACLSQVLVTHARMWRQAGVSIVWSVVLVSVTAALRNSGGARGISCAYLLAWTWSIFAYGGMALLFASPKYAEPVYLRPATGAQEVLDGRTAV
jgi:hypothetical protein